MYLSHHNNFISLKKTIFVSSKSEARQFLRKLPKTICLVLKFGTGVQPFLCFG